MISELPNTGPMSGSTAVQAYGGPMMGDTLTFQVSPSHLLDQPPKRYKQQVLMSNTHAVSSLQHAVSAQPTQVSRHQPLLLVA